MRATRPMATLEAKRQEAKRKAFNNGERSLIEKHKIVTREVGAVTYVWPAQAE